MATFSLNPEEQIKKYGALTTGEAATGLRSLEQPITTTPTPTLTPPAPLAPTPTPSLAPNPALSSLTPEQRLAYDASIAKSATSEAALGGALMTGTPAPTPATSPTSTPSGTTVPSGTNILSQEQLDNIYKLAADIGAKGGEYASSDVNSIVLRATGQSLYDLSKVSPELADSIIAKLSPLALGKREETVTNIENQRAETERKQFEERMRADEESRRRQQDATRAEEGIRQMQERASAVSGLARTGSLYTTTAGGLQPGGEIDIEGPGSIVGDLKRRNEYELSMYRMKLEDQSRKFNEAMQDGNAALANVHSQNLKDIESDFYNRRQQQTKDLIDARNQILEQQKGLKETAMQDIGTLIAGGQEAQVTPSYLQGLEQRTGTRAGWGQAYVNVVKQNIAITKAKTEAERRKLEIDILKDTSELIANSPKGLELTINGETFFGLGRGDITTFSNDDGRGNQTLVAYDKLNNTIQTQTIAGVGKRQEGWEYKEDANGQWYAQNKFSPQIIPMGMGTSQWDDLSFSTGQSLAEGSIWTRNGIPAPQCGQLVNDLTGLKFGDTIEQKRTLIDRKINSNNAQIGDVIVQGNGQFGNTGHVSIVEDVFNVGGQKFFQLMESNYPLKGRISHSRRINANDATIEGFARGQLNLALNTGPDSSVQEITQQTDSRTRALVDSARFLMPGLQKEAAPRFQSEFIRRIQSGDTAGARDLVIEHATSDLPAELQTQVRKRVTAIDSLADIRQQMNEYVSGGGDLGIFVGTKDDIARKIGRQVKPELTDLATKMTLSLFAYRNAVSGAAFTESEQRAYESVFPSKKNTVKVNEALIGSLMDSFQLAQQSILGGKIGTDNYRAIFREPEAQSPQNVSVASSLIDDFLTQQGY